jgi:threonine dehydrogenase-like Zn-dependent dehydrogenase
VLGCAILAAAGAGVHAGVQQAAEAMVHETEVLEPDKDRHEEYQFFGFGATVTVDPASQDLGAVVREVSRGVGIDSTIVAIGRAELVNQAVELARVGGPTASRCAR